LLFQHSVKFMEKSKTQSTGYKSLL
jgi:hypothetical protein